MKYKRINRNSLRQFKRSRERLVHLSAELVQVPQFAKDGTALLSVKTVVKRPGTTYNVGNNARKRELRAHR